MLTRMGAELRRNGGRARALVVLAGALGACTPAARGTPAAATSSGMTATVALPSPQAAATPASLLANPTRFKSKDPNTFTDITLNDPDTLDPAYDYESVGGQVIQNTYDTL